MKSILLSMLMQLMTEKFAKEMIIKVLEWLTAITKTPKDNEVLAILKDNWNMK